HLFRKLSGPSEQSDLFIALDQARLLEQPARINEASGRQARFNFGKLLIWHRLGNDSGPGLPKTDDADVGMLVLTIDERIDDVPRGLLPGSGIGDPSARQRSIRSDVMGESRPDDGLAVKREKNTS